MASPLADPTWRSGGRGEPARCGHQRPLRARAHAPRRSRLGRLGDRAPRDEMARRHEARGRTAEWRRWRLLSPRQRTGRRTHGRVLGAARLRAQRSGPRVVRAPRLAARHPRAAGCPLHHHRVQAFSGGQTSRRGGRRLAARRSRRLAQHGSLSRGRGPALRVRRRHQEQAARGSRAGPADPLHSSGDPRASRRGPRSAARALESPGDGPRAARSLE